MNRFIWTMMRLSREFESVSWGTSRGEGGLTWRSSEESHQYIYQPLVVYKVKLYTFVFVFIDTPTITELLFYQPKILDYLYPHYSALE